MVSLTDNSFEVIDIGDMLSGVAAAGYTFSRPGIFNFDGTKYNTSTRRFRPSGVCSSRLQHELFYVAAGADSRYHLLAHQLESTPVRLEHK